MFVSFSVFHYVAKSLLGIPRSNKTVCLWVSTYKVRLCISLLQALSVKNPIYYHVFIPFPYCIFPKIIYPIVWCEVGSHITIRMFYSNKYASLIYWIHFLHCIEMRKFYVIQLLYILASNILHGHFVISFIYPYESCVIVFVRTMIGLRRTGNKTTKALLDFHFFIIIHNWQTDDYVFGIYCVWEYCCLMTVRRCRLAFEVDTVTCD